MNVLAPRRAYLALAVTATIATALAPAAHPTPVLAQQLASPAPSAAATTADVTPAAAPATPAPPSPPPAASPTPAAPSPEPSHWQRHRGPSSQSTSDEPSPTPTPTSPAFSTLDGYWEVVLQTPANYTYSSFTLHQNGDEITGIWNQNGKKLPLTGNYDGRQFKFVVADAPHDVTLAGYVEGATDMVGIVDDGVNGDDEPAFTASHRETIPVNIFPKRSKT